MVYISQIAKGEDDDDDLGNISIKMEKEDKV